MSAPGFSKNFTAPTPAKAVDPLAVSDASNKIESSKLQQRKEIFFNHKKESDATLHFMKRAKIVRGGFGQETKPEATPCNSPVQKENAKPIRRLSC